MSINDRIRAMAREAGCDAIELREILVTLAERMRIHLDDAVDAAEGLRRALLKRAVAVSARPNRDRAGEWVVVVRCPHCGGEHVHGASTEELEPGERIGHRVADCGGAGGYVVVVTNPLSGPPARP